MSKDPLEIAGTLLETQAKIIGFGVYIWNTTQTLSVIQKIKELSPETVIVLGGPEVSYESEAQEICRIADYVFKGESENSFYEFCHTYFQKQERPTRKLIAAPLPDLAKICLPYDLYTDADIQNRVIYVEASRGCPYKCEYCLSSLDLSVRPFPLEQFLMEMEKLLLRGARQFKFVDRTFNLSPTISASIMTFFLKHAHLGIFLHFEMVPDRLPENLKELIKEFPAGALQFEIGIQTWNPEVAKNVSRRQDFQKIRENLDFLRTHTKVHTHVDLIAGLPGETLESFAKGFNAVWELKADEIQLGILKRLKGTPIVRHDLTFNMVYDSTPPFSILSTKDMDGETIVKLSRLAKYWDLFGNSGNFILTLEYLRKNQTPMFEFMWDFSEFQWIHWDRTHSIPLKDFFKSTFEFLCQRYPREIIIGLLAKDYTSGASRSLPDFLSGEVSPVRSSKPARPSLKRQQRHLREQSDNA